MKYRPRIYYTEEQKALMWDRWQKGETLHAIVRLFDRSRKRQFKKIPRVAVMGN